MKGGVGRITVDAWWRKCFRGQLSVLPHEHGDAGRLACTSVSTTIQKLSRVINRLWSCAKAATLTGLRLRMNRTPTWMPSTSAQHSSFLGAVQTSMIWPLKHQHVTLHRAVRAIAVRQSVSGQPEMRWSAAVPSILQCSSVANS